MQPHSNSLPDRLLRFTPFLGCLICLHQARGQDYLTPDDVVLPRENASVESMRQSAGNATLHLGTLDFFPHAAVTSLYDDNLLIQPSNTLSDVEWTFSPGMTVTAGDINSYLPGPVSLRDIRGLLNYSLLDDSSSPQRFLGVDYTAAVNLYTQHSQYNGVDHNEGLSAGYAFSRLAIGVDQNYFRGNVKDNQTGNLVAKSMWDARLQFRYELTDRSDVSINGQYHELDYPNQTYQGYQEFRNGDWYDRRFGGRLQVGVGAAFGFVYPQVSPAQTYQQLLVRGNYLVSGKLELHTDLGMEFRQYDSGASGTVDPVFNLSVVYHPRDATTFTLEAHRRDQPSFGGDYNYLILGFSAGIRQLLLDRVYAQLMAGYDNTVYALLNSGTSNDRADNNYFVQASLQYEFNAHLGAALFWNFRQQDSTIHTYTYVDNLVGVRAYWYF